MRSSQSGPIALLDACVLIPSLQVDTLLRAAEQGFYRVRFSYKILDEFERAFAGRLVKDYGLSMQDATARALGKRSAMETAFAFDEALVEDFESLEDLATNHWKDRHVLAAAIKAGANLIVTSNLKHFKEESLAPFRIEAIHPDDFLVELLQEHTPEMIDLLRKQSAAYRKRVIPFNEMLDILQRSDPKFIARVRALLTKGD